MQNCITFHKIIRLMTIKLMLFSIFSILLMTCSNSSEQKCKFGSPTPIFVQDNQEILNEQFNLKGQSSSENIQFKNGLKLQITQSGCNHLEQIFEFHTNENPKSFSESVDLLLQYLMYFSKINDKYLMYQQWANSIHQKRTELKRGKTTELSPGFNINIDYINGENATILLKITN